MLYEGVESRSDGVHWIHWTRIDSSGDVHFSIRKSSVLVLTHRFKNELIVMCSVPVSTHGFKNE